MNYELLIPGLRLWISLGCTAEERSNPQPVDVDIRMNFTNEPLGCQTDQLQHVSCYKQVVEHVIESVQNQSFNLIEFLAARIFDAVEKHIIAKDATLEVVITKPNHPVPHVQKGIVFKYCRRLQQKSL